MKTLFLSLAVAVVGYFYFNQEKSPNKTPSRSLATSPSPIGTVERVIGQAFVTDSQKVSATVKQSVFEAQTIETQAKSFVRLKMIDDSQFNIGPNSVVKLSTYVMHSADHREVGIDLIKGALRSHFIKHNKKGYLKVKSGGAVFGVRGTEFITLNNGSQVKMVLLEGSVEVVRPNQTTVTVKPNEKIEFSGEPNAQPQPVSAEELTELLAQWSLDEVSTTTPVSNFIKPTVNEKEIKQKALTQTTKITQKLNEIIASKSLSFSQKKELIEKSSAPEKAELLNKLKKITLNQKYKQNIATINDPAIFENMSTTDREAVLSKTLTATQEKAQELAESNRAAVLITPDNKVVFFEEFPELKALLPRDDSGNILGIRVDENLEPIEQFSIATATSLNEVIEQVSSQVIPVVNHFGEVVALPILSPQSETAVIIPSTPQGEVAGINISTLEQVIVSTQTVTAPTTYGTSSLTNQEAQPNLIEAIINPIANTTSSLLEGLLGSPEATREPATQGATQPKSLLKGLFK